MMRTGSLSHLNIMSTVSISSTTSNAMSAPAPEEQKLSSPLATAVAAPELNAKATGISVTEKAIRRVRAAMHKEGIAIGISYEAIHLTTHFRRKGFKPGEFPVSERIARETVSLPLVADMTQADVERVCAAMGRVLRRKAA